MHLEIDRHDIRTRRMAETVAPEDAATGAVVLALESFALTSNNVSYAHSGDLLDYWGFFPTDVGWGRLPVMGFGRVTHSEVDGISVGERFFGFYPAADHHIVEASPSRTGFIDVGAHREPHAMAYRTFDRADQTLSTDDEHRYLLLRGLFVTSHLCEDFLADNDMFGAAQVLVTSASSKTSLALAHELRRGGRARSVGLTSPANIDFVAASGLYDEIVSYDDLESLDPTVPSVVVDMAGNAQVLARIHAHFDGSLTHSCRVGATHWVETTPTGSLAGPKPQFFFAPSQLAKRGKEWGRAELEARMASALALFLADSIRWMLITVSAGPDAVLATWDALVSGRLDPAEGHILSI
ncbi:MAG: DUF2855 family protein [Ilumatobacteraceae bacterium]